MSRNKHDIHQWHSDYTVSVVKTTKLNKFRKLCVFQIHSPNGSISMGQ